MKTSRYAALLWLVQLGWATAHSALAQQHQPHVHGQVRSADGQPIGYAVIRLSPGQCGTSADSLGSFHFSCAPGQYTLSATALGYAPFEQKITLGTATLDVAVVMQEDVMATDVVVVSGTRTERRRTEAPVAVNVLDAKTLAATQSLCLADGLCYQPGLRVETDCQTCNYTQVRMNGLAGGYTQLLVNGRPVLSSVASLYGLEQFPTSLVDRIEVVRGGGSASYGSSAIGGTINIITRDPAENSWSLTTSNAAVAPGHGTAYDGTLAGSATVVGKQQKAGVAIFASRRQRSEWDANSDGYSEQPRLTGYTLAASGYIKPGDKGIALRYSLLGLNETRDGGDQLDLPPHQRTQTEQRHTHIGAGTLAADLPLRGGKAGSLALYGGGQYTGRTHYTGAYGADGYGTTSSYSVQGGAQYNYTHTLLGGKNRLSAGAEYLLDDVLDQIPAYTYKVDQTVQQLGGFVQADWEARRWLTILAGVRLNYHSLLNRPVANPRVSLLFRPHKQVQLRLGYASGFRGPQAFDADMHIAFAGGGISRIQLAKGLLPEDSHSGTVSLDWNRYWKNGWGMGITVSGFATQLRRAFVLEEIGTDSLGNKVLARRNGGNALVAGATAELRIAWKDHLELEAGLTWQRSTYSQPVAWSAEAPAEQHFLRVPSLYGFVTAVGRPTRQLSLTASGIYTGPMRVPHFGGAPGVGADQVTISPHFFELGLKAGYEFRFAKTDLYLELFAGGHNLVNSYQNDFDTGPDRDSNYIYGPNRPRTIYAGLKLGM